MHGQPQRVSAGEIDVNSGAFDFFTAPLRGGICEYKHALTNLFQPDVHV